MRTLDRWVWRPLVVAVMLKDLSMLLGLSFEDGTCGSLLVTFDPDRADVPGVMHHEHPPEPTMYGNHDALGLIRAMRAQLKARSCESWYFLFQAFPALERLDEVRQIRWQVLLVPLDHPPSFDHGPVQVLASVVPFDQGFFEGHSHVHLGVYEGLEEAAEVAEAWSPPAERLASCACVEPSA